MKKGAKITIFIASMALTVGSLMTFAGGRHCGYRMHGYNACMGYSYNHGDCAKPNDNRTSDAVVK